MIIAKKRRKNTRDQGRLGENGIFEKELERNEELL